MLSTSAAGAGRLEDAEVSAALAAGVVRAVPPGVDAMPSPLWGVAVAGASLDRSLLL